MAKMRRACAAVMISVGAIPAIGAEEGPLHLMVRLIHDSAVGCGTRDNLQRIAEIAMTDGDEAVIARAPELDCRLVRSFRGEVVNADESAICVIGVGNTRCLWFAPAGFAPVMPR